MSLGARFMLWGSLLVATSVAAGAFGTVRLLGLGRVVGVTLRDTEATTAAIARLQASLEREDDALLLALTSETARASANLEAERQRAQAALGTLASLLTTPDEALVSARLREDIAAYERAGDRLVTARDQPGALERYHRDVNPYLRRAVSAAGAIRDTHFRDMRKVAAFTRDAVARAGLVMAALCLGAFVLSTLLALHLARLVLRPVHELGRQLEALTRNDFSGRMSDAGGDELGQLAAGFNRMAEHIAAFRRSSLGELMRANDLLEGTLAALPDAVVVLDGDRAVRAANAEAERILGGAPPLGTRLVALPLPASVTRAVEAAFAGRSGADRPLDLGQAFTVATATGERKLLPRAVPFALGDGRRGAVLILNDVTDLVRIDEMRVELVGVASHELRTPLTTLRMTLEMLQEETRAAASERQRALIDTAFVGVQQLAGTIDEFLDLTRIEAGQLRLNLDAVDVSAIVRREVERFRPQCEAAAITLESAIAAAPPARVDATRIAVVISNVLGNAVKYTPTGGRIAVACAAEPGRVVISVTDSGRGIPAGLRERIFDKFFRVEYVDGGDPVHGSGIGLYLSRQIIDAHRGRISAGAGSDGKGARLVIELPLDGPA